MSLIPILIFCFVTPEWFNVMNQIHSSLKNPSLRRKLRQSLCSYSGLHNHLPSEIFIWVSELWMIEAIYCMVLLKNSQPKWLITQQQMVMMQSDYDEKMSWFAALCWVYVLNGVTLDTV